MNAAEWGAEDDADSRARETFDDVVRQIVTAPLERVQSAVEESLDSHGQSLQKTMTRLASQVGNIRRGEGVRDVSLPDIQDAVHAVSQAVARAQLEVQRSQADTASQITTAVSVLSAAIDGAAEAQADTAAELVRQMESRFALQEAQITQLRDHILDLRRHIVVGRWLLTAVAMLVVVFGVAAIFISG